MMPVIHTSSLKLCNNCVNTIELSQIDLKARQTLEINVHYGLNIPFLVEFWGGGKSKSA